MYTVVTLIVVTSALTPEVIPPLFAAYAFNLTGIVASAYTVGAERAVDLHAFVRVHAVASYNAMAIAVITYTAGTAVTISVSELAV